MITRIEAVGYKCLADVDVTLRPLNVLVGPNGSGKSTLLDVVLLLHDALLRYGDVDAAVRKRARQLRELVWMNEDTHLDLALEARLPSPGPEHKADAGDEHLRYEVRIGTSGNGMIEVLEERLWALEAGAEAVSRLHARQGPADDAGQEQEARGRTLLMARRPADVTTSSGQSDATVVIHSLGEDDHPAALVGEDGEPWPFAPPRERLALAAIPRQPDEFRLALWLRELLEDRVLCLQLDPLEMRRPCPPDAPRSFAGDGHNLALIAGDLQQAAPERFEWWIEHLQGVIEGLERIDVKEQEHDRHLYLEAAFENGLRVPSWLLSDGTLRLLALTLLAYLPPEDRIFIIEEPENGIHPRAVEAVMQSLTSAYEGQVFVATHSPIVLALVEREDLLCFGLAPDGSTQVVRGEDHPALRDWQKSVPISDLFAAGVLG